MNIILGLLLVLLLFHVDRQPYSKIIRSWTKILRVKFVYHGRYTDDFNVDLVDDVLYVSRYHKMTHDPKVYVYSIAHELGHIIDGIYRENAYEDPDEIFDGMTEQHTIYEEEIRAWSIAKQLLIDANIYDESFFIELRDKCLQNYKTYLQLG